MKLMKLKNVKEITELLLVKKNNFIIQEDEQVLLNELVYLLELAACSNNTNYKLNCNCEINYKTIHKEIELNQCKDCRLPLNIS